MSCPPGAAAQGALSERRAANSPRECYPLLELVLEKPHPCRSNMLLRRALEMTSQGRAAGVWFCVILSYSKQELSNLIRASVSAAGWLVGLLVYALKSLTDL